MPIKKTDSIAALMPVAQFEEEDYLLMATQEGLIKKTPLSQFQDVRANGLIAMKLKVMRLLPLSQFFALEQTGCSLLANLLQIW